MLDDRKVLAIQHLAEGEKSKTDIAKLVGVSRQAIYNWLDDEKFRTELDARLQQRKNLVEKIIDSKLENAVESLVDLSKKSSNDMVKLRALTYMIDRGLGKTPDKVELTAKQEDTDVSDDLLSIDYNDVIDITPEDEDN